MATQVSPYDTDLTAIVVGHKNETLIADQVLPRVPVGSRAYSYSTFNINQELAIPETALGRKSQPNEVEFNQVPGTGYCQDHGLDDVIPQSEIDDAPDGYDPAFGAAESLADMVALKREQRVANLVFATGTYAAGNQTDLSEGTQWSTIATADFIADFLAAQDALITPGNIMVFGQATWAKVRVNAGLLKAYHGNAGGSGIITAEWLRDYLQLDAVLVGRAYINAANKALSPTTSNAWGKHAALLRVEPEVRPGMRIPTFGWTAQYGTAVSSRIPENIGLHGGVRVRVGESVDEKIVAPSMGYLFEKAVA